MNNLETLDDVLELFGSVGRVANAVGVSRQAVYKWRQALPERRRHELIGAAVTSGLLEVKRAQKAALNL